MVLRYVICLASIKVQNFGRFGGLEKRLQLLFVVRISIGNFDPLGSLDFLLEVVGAAGVDTDMDGGL